MKATIISILVAIALIGGAILISRDGSQPEIAAHTVSVIDGVQVVEIKAKGGYQPRKSVAQAGIPTVIRFTTASTFDCSAAVRIPSLGISKMLTNTGTTTIDIGQPKAGVLKGNCGMGMYPFEIEFKG